MYWKIKSAPLRITKLLAHAAKADRVPHGYVGRYARSHAMLHPQFASPSLAPQALVRAGKPSPTARRYVKYALTGWKIKKIGVDKIKRNI
jgi:hypothetical protein